MPVYCMTNVRSICYHPEQFCKRKGANVAKMGQGEGLSNTAPMDTLLSGYQPTQDIDRDIPMNTAMITPFTHPVSSAPACSTFLGL